LISIQQILSRNFYNGKEGCGALFEQVIEEIQFDIDQIDRLFASYAVLFESIQQTQPDLIEATAVASVLHSFYNGLESIFLLIAKRIDGHIPTGEKWHRQLLLQMTQTVTQRQHVITMELAHDLESYLGFRHFYRHSYSFFLDWGQLEKLVAPVHRVWSQAKIELNAFIDHLSST
jgi:hypothetical protein